MRLYCVKHKAFFHIDFIKLVKQNLTDVMT